MLENMKSDPVANNPMYEQLLSANEKSRHLERQLHDKERELKRKINELNQAHKSNRELQVRIDELREEMSFYKPTSPTGNASNASLFVELDQLYENPDESDPSKELVQEAIDLQKNLLIDDMSPDLTLRCYKSLLNGLSNCNQQVVELKQEMWQIYQSILFTNSILRNHVRSTLSGSDVDDEREEAEVQTPHPINLSLVMTDLSNLVRKVTTVKVSLANAKVDLKSANNQLLQTIQQKLSLQKELEAWQEDMELMVERSVTEKDGMRRVNSLRHPRRPKPNQNANRLSLLFTRNDNPYSVDTSQSTQFFQEISNGSPAADQSEKPGGFFTSWLRRRWNPTPNKTSSQGDTST